MYSLLAVARAVLIIMSSVSQRLPNSRICLHGFEDAPKLWKQLDKHVPVMLSAWEGPKPDQQISAWSMSITFFLIAQRMLTPEALCFKGVHTKYLLSSTAATVHYWENVSRPAVYIGTFS